MNIQRLKFSLARGARIQVHTPGGAREWETIVYPYFSLGQRIGREYRVHPKDEHLQYGPVSTAFRDMALYTDSADLPEITELFMDLAGSNWLLGGADYDDAMLSDWTRLFFAEWLADEGL